LAFPVGTGKKTNGEFSPWGLSAVNPVPCGQMKWERIMWNRTILLLKDRQAIALILRRIADFCEKMAVGAALVWFFQNRNESIYVAVIAFLISLILTFYSKGEK
jgi:hypothetical protein